MLTRFRRFVRRTWTFALGLLIGIVLGVGIPLLWTLWKASKPGTSFRIAQEIPASGDGFASALYQSLGVRLAPGHAVTLLDNGRVFDAIVEDIGRAQRSVDIVMYIWEQGAASDRVTAALVARASAGVRCRLVIDAFGSGDFDETVKPPLAAAGCDVRTFRPLPGIDPLARNHRKLVIVDGGVAITGGFGVRDDWLGDGISRDGWRDTNVRFTGPAAREAEQAFAENWQEAGGPLLEADAFPEPAAGSGVRAAFVSSTASPVVTRAERLTQLVILAAKRRLWIANAYLSPSDEIVALLKQQARRGVDVRLLVAGEKTDSKPARALAKQLYPELLAAGIRVWEYTPSMMHAKTMLADDQLAVVGTINLDPLSLNKLDEDALVIDDAGIAAELATAFTADCGHAQELRR